jgi:hypothetical protein
VIRDQVSRVPLWIPTAAFYVVAALSLTSRVPSWTGDVAVGLWLAYLALERDQVLAKAVLIAALVTAAKRSDLSGRSPEGRSLHNAGCALRPEPQRLPS